MPANHIGNQLRSATAVGHIVKRNTGSTPQLDAEHVRDASKLGGGEHCASVVLLHPVDVGFQRCRWNFGAHDVCYIESGNARNGCYVCQRVLEVATCVGCQGHCTRWGHQKCRTVCGRALERLESEGAARTWAVLNDPA